MIYFKILPMTEVMGKYILIYFTILIMMLLITLILTFLLLIIIYQDWKFRAVWWPLFPMVFIIQCSLSVRVLGFNDFLLFLAMNLGILLMQLTVLYFYFAIKQKEMKIPLFKQYLGWGDVLLFLFLTTAFSPLNFVLFVMSGLILSLFLFLIIRKKSKTIPLAGILAAEYVIFILVTKFYLDLNPYVELIPITP